MSIAMQNQINELRSRVETLEEMISSLPKNGSDSQLEIRIQTLEDKYKAMNARMGKRSFLGMNS